MIRLTDVTDDEAYWGGDDDLETISIKNPLAQNVMLNLDEYITDCCRDDCRWD